MDRWMQAMGGEARALLALGLMLLLGFASTRATKRLGLPNVSGYIVCGMLIGPRLLGLIPQAMVDGMGFVSDIALAFIAFGVGRFFRREAIQRAGGGVLLITALEALLAGALVGAVMRLCFGMDWALSLLLGAIATATAPASTVMTINQYHARGEFVELLLQVVALDDVVCLLVFSLIAAILSAGGGAGAGWMRAAAPLILNIMAIALGAGFAVLLSRLLPPGRTKDNRLILALALLLCLSGLCAAANVSPLLSCMAFGAVFMNRTHDKKLFKQIDKFTPPVMMLFFIRSGMKLDVKALGAFGLAGVAYFLARIAGKYAGAYLGCLIARRPAATRKYLGAALVPQAGVAIGLSSLAERILPPEIGGVLVTIILSSSVLYELVGPACAKAALIRAGAIARDQPPANAPQNGREGKP